MNPEHVRELWLIRFLKILEVEEDSFIFYQKLLRERAPLLEQEGIKPVIKQLMRDEEKHIQIAKELVRLAGGDAADLRKAGRVKEKDERI